MTYDTKVSWEEQQQYTYENTDEARRVTLVRGGSLVSPANPLPVDITNSGSKVVSIEYQAVATVAQDTETTVLTFTNGGADMWVDAIGGTGTARSEWFIYINSVLKVKRRMSVAHPFLDVRMFGFRIAVGDVVDVKVKHPETATQDFNAEMRYYR